MNRNRTKGTWKAVTLAVTVVVLAAGVVVPAAAQSVGGGVSVWVPESAWVAGNGSVGVETAFGSSLGLGDVLSLPFGVVYDQVFAQLPETDGTVGGSPWFYSDTLIGYLMASARVGAGPVYVDLFGGLAGHWNARLVPLEKQIERDIAPSGRVVTFEEPIQVDGGRVGWGWLAGGGVGMTFDQISVDLNVTYRLLKADAVLSGTYSSVDVAGGTVDTGVAWNPSSVRLRLAGLAIGINASYAF